MKTKKFLSILQQDRYDENYYKKPGQHEFYICSGLDESYVKIGIRVPEEYDINQKYPVFLILLSSDVEFFSSWIDMSALSEPVLCFDISGRGYTAGSYIGESSTLEILEWIKKNYPIDKDRIYIIGLSNGGFAAYSIAQNHPEIPNAIFPLISYPNVDTSDNLSNIPIYQMVSPKDHVFHGRENMVKDKLNKYKNYVQIDFKEMLHSYFRPYIAHKVILNELLKIKKERYPNKIFFKTQRNRHLQSYYLKLHGIKEDLNIAKIKSEIVNQKQIHIWIQGSYGFTIEIPPQIDTTQFSVTINKKKTFRFIN